MRHVIFRTVLERTLGIAGLKLDTALTDQLEQVVNFINLRVDQAYDFQPWPELVKIEERAFAQGWYATRTYGIGEVAWDDITDTYYASLQTANLNHALTEASWWEETTTPAALCVPYEQYAKTKMGRVWNVWESDPRVLKHGERSTLFYLEAEEGVVVPDAGKTVWIAYSPFPNQFTHKEFDSGSTYERYDLALYLGTSGESGVFHERGSVYVREINTGGSAVWVLVKFPAVLQRFVTFAAGSDFLRYNGRKEQADGFEGIAYRHMDDEWAKVGDGWKKLIGYQA